MSDYFGALMRSSGMAIGPAAAITDPTAPSPIEVEVDQVPSATVPAAEFPTSPAETRVAPPRVATANSSPGEPVTPAPVPRVDPIEDHRADTVAHNRADAVEADRADVSRTSRPERVPPPPRAAAEPVVDGPDASRGEALVRAAMRWVAADAGVVSPDRAARSRQEGDEGISVGATPVLRLPGVDGHVTTASPSLAIDGPVTSQKAAAPVSPRSPHAAISAEAPATAPVATEEVVEISIGAIHLRVDAPAAQTIAAPAVAPPAAARRPASGRRSGSSLSRRAMRRI